ncbi:unnamed protein product [Kuraishia capsulata CBS 1993]|uniref:NAD(P)-binding domain-containing protein n=1 Tax=Kuraishia capsulata CBS 1993 TaxID=1382522 RepID=W6MFB3_9ASCO|nr:uncharacterized protein KUCA_T00000401001 [Kuraishia capsulata CBS 1993]CDK24439.1 unnamed protein product [Kuraishia capsulata CBS 1993]
MVAIEILGGTGLVGSHVLQLATKLSSVSHITTFTRRAPKTQADKIEAVVEQDSDKWGDLIKAHKADVFVSAFGTTRKNAGSAENFTKIDYGINYEAAKAAKEAGISTFVIVSSIGASASSMFLYPSTKGKLEDDIIALGFPKTVILRPGLLLGEREVSKGAAEDTARAIFSRFKGTFLSKYMMSPVESEDVAKCALYHALQAPASETNPEVVIVSAENVIADAKKYQG